MRILAIIAAIWVAGTVIGQWETTHAAWHLLAVDLGPRPTLNDADRALLSIRCADQPSARERARCALDQNAVRRPMALWDAASADLARRHDEARRVLGFVLAVALLPPAALLAAGWLIDQFTWSAARKSRDS